MQLPIPKTWAGLNRHAHFTLFICIVSDLKSKAVHFEEHLAGEEDDEEQVGVILEIVEPRRLAVVFRGEHTRVEEHEHDDEPEHSLKEQKVD